MDSLAAVVGSAKANNIIFVNPRSVRFARTASVSCSVSPGKRSAVALEEDAFTVTKAGWTVDSSATSRIVPG